MKKRWIALIVIGTALATLLASRSIASTTQSMKAGTWVFEFHTTNVQPVGMLAVFTGSGQIMFSDRTDFGWTPPGAQTVYDSQCGVQPGAPQAGETQSPGYGTWRMNGAKVEFMVLSYRYDAQGNPIGTLRATGSSKPGLRKINGTATIQWLKDGEDELNGAEACHIDVTYSGRKVPAVQPPTGQ